MSDSEEEESYSEEDYTSDESGSEMEYTSMDDDEEISEVEEVEEGVTKKQEKQMLITKLAHFKQEKSPLETLVFTSSQHHSTPNLQNDVERELALFEYTYAKIRVISLSFFIILSFLTI